MPILSADGQILGNDELLNLTIDQMTVPLVILVVENAVLLYWSYVLPQRYLSTDGEDVGEDLIDRGILMLILPLMAGISVAGAFSVSGSTASPAFFVAFVVVVSIVKIGIEQAISFRIIRRA